MKRHLEGHAKRLSAYVGEDEQYDGKPLYRALMEQSRIQGCAGATALRGMAGFGASSRDIAKHGLRMSSDLPVLVAVIDDAIRITALAEVWTAMLPAGLIVLEDVNVVAYVSAENEFKPEVGAAE
ncbi:MAG: DUF190 domain-containing protein [Coriobacteriia bacterium]|nr:DUF190 domain-containing protein [Coriobacteriia bacterium]